MRPILTATSIERWAARGLGGRGEGQAMVGKNPHRPEGKTSDSERMRTTRDAKVPGLKERHDRDIVEKDRHGAPTRFPAEESLGGSRPGVESRVREAVERLRDED